MRFSNIRIRHKITLAFAAVVIGAAAMGLVVQSRMQSIETARQTTTLHNAIITATIEARGAMTRQENSLRSFLITRDDPYSGRVQRHAEAFAKHMDTIRQVGSDMSDLGAKLDLVARNSAAWQNEIAGKAMALARIPETLGQAASLITSDAASALIDPIEDTLDGLRDAATAADVAQQTDAYSQAAFVFFAGMAALLLLSSGLGLFLTRTLARPIVRHLKTVSREHQAMQAGARASSEADLERQAEEAVINEGYVAAHTFMSEVEAGFTRLSSSDRRRAAARRGDRGARHVETGRFKVKTASGTGAARSVRRAAPRPLRPGPSRRREAPAAAAPLQPPPATPMIGKSSNA